MYLRPMFKKCAPFCIYLYISNGKVNTVKYDMQCASIFFVLLKEPMLQAPWFKTSEITNSNVCLSLWKSNSKGMNLVFVDDWYRNSHLCFDTIISPIIEQNIPHVYCLGASKQTRNHYWNKTGDSSVPML